jgi:Flp pilus assembly protein TadG
MSRFSQLKARMRIFIDDATGTLSVEAVLMFPILAWAYVAMFTYFDVFKVRNISQKSAYAISDALSRETDAVDEAYINGLQSLYQYLTPSANTTRLRVSEVKYAVNAVSGVGDYSVTWSYATGTSYNMTTADLQGFLDRLPVMANGERALLVETLSSWAPAFDIGLDDMIFSDFVVTSPRFASQLAWSGLATYTGGGSDNNDLVGVYDSDIDDPTGVFESYWQGGS